MKENTIKCPKCGTAITIDDQIIIQRVKEQIQKAEEAKALGMLKTREAELMADFNKRLELETNSKLKKVEIEKSLKDKQIDELNRRELEQMKKTADLETKIKRQEIETLKKVEQEKKLIEEQVRKEEQERNQSKLSEKEKQLEDTKKALAEAQRKAQQGSMQTQGEVLELSLEELLKNKFPADKIEPVPKGISGADIIQTVIDASGGISGMIVWETKQTKVWSEEWIQKLKDDSRSIKANISVLVSEVLPREITHFGIYHGVWVCDFNSIIGLTTAIRHQLIAVKKSIAVHTGKEEKKDILYNYLCSQTFASRIESIVETFLNMKSSLDKEKMALNKIWANREAQINRLTESTVKTFGDIQGIAGLNMPNIEILELEAASEEIKDTKKGEVKKDSDSSQFGLF